MASSPRSVGTSGAPNSCEVFTLPCNEATDDEDNCGDVEQGMSEFNEIEFTVSREKSIVACFPPRAKICQTLLHSVIVWGTLSSLRLPAV